MLRVVLVSLAAGAVATFALAQTDPIEARRAIMKQIGSDVYAALPKMIKGQDAYDQAKVDAALDHLTEAAEKLPALFPEESKSGGGPSNYAASPKIWENKADFDARLAKFADAVATARPQATSLEGLRAAYPMVRQSCNSCHQDYRIRTN